MGMEILGFIVVYVLPLLFQMALQVTVLSFGVYWGLRRYDKYLERNTNRNLEENRYFRPVSFITIPR